MKTLRKAAHVSAVLFFAVALILFEAALLTAAYGDGERFRTSGITETSAQDGQAVSGAGCTYRVEIYLQSVGNAEEYEAQETRYGVGRIGEELSPEIPSFEHFELNEERSTTTATLAEGENVFGFYYDRESVTVTYDTNLPDGSRDCVTRTYRYGETATEQPNAVEGYYFLGWAQERNASAVYAAGEAFCVTEDAAYYAVWAKLYENGRGDGTLLAVAVNGTDGVREVVLLYEDGTTQNGVLDEESGYFRAGETEGRLEENGFLLSDSGTYVGFSLAENAENAEECGVLELDFASGTARYTLGGETVSGGYTYLVGENGAYTGQYEFSGGDVAFRFVLRGLCFLREGEEKGSYILCVSGEESFSFYVNIAIALDGYGGAQYTCNGVTVGGTYRGGEDGTWVFVGDDGEEFRFRTGGVSLIVRDEPVNTFEYAEETSGDSESE